MKEHIKLDFERKARTGFPEAILCSHKTVEQCVEIARQWKERYLQDDNPHEHIGYALFTRVNATQAEAVLRILPDARWEADAHMLIWPAQPPSRANGDVVVVCAGTSDSAVAQEATLTAQYGGAHVTTIYDVGVAGIHRLLAHTDRLRQADVVIGVAGMEGALVSVIAGLVSCPVIAVPTSVGYGASYQGLAALLSMLNACAPGVSVVNIDNGYGAGYIAAQIVGGKTLGDNKAEATDKPSDEIDSSYGHQQGVPTQQGVPERKEEQPDA